MRRVLKWLFGGVVLMALLAAFAALLVYLVLQKSIAPNSGNQELAGLGKTVEVVLDKNAIPHIHADNYPDAARALGFMHARDRLWQMEVLRMAGQGRLSEMFGDATLETDQFLRTIDMAGASRNSFEALLPETRESVEAYVAGINAYMERETTLLEPGLGAEFLILGHSPEKWEPWQSVLVIKVMGLTLGANMDKEITRFALARQGFSAKEIDDLLPYGPRDNPPALPDLLSIYGLKSIEEEQEEAQKNSSLKRGLFDFSMDWPTGQSASNNWVISGSRTDTGKPILANDPHLRLTAPSTFHLAHLSWTENGKKKDVIGGAVPGTPFIIVGRTNAIAWGLTTTNLDAQDLFLEKLDTTQNNYLTEDGWKPLEEETSTIGKAGKSEREINIRRTRHGPLLPRSYKAIGDVLPENYGLALNWPGLVHDDTTLDSLYLNNRAESVAEFIEAGKYTVSPMQSIVAADVGGQIALGAPARIPLRKPANLIKGRAPVPGWNPTYHWESVLPPTAGLKIVDPAEGAITTANANYLPENFKTHITYDWAEHYRQARSESLVLGRNEKHTIQASREIIADTYSPAMIRFRDLSARIMQDGVGVLPDVRDALKKWDGHMLADRPEPLIMLAWFRHLNINMLEDDTGELFKNFERGYIAPLLGMLEAGRARDWCDDQTTDIEESCAITLGSSLEAAMAELSESFGDDWRNWKYGDAHTAYSEHRPFGQVGALSKYFDIELPSAGGPYTLLRAQTKFQHDKPYRSRHGAAFRAIYDFSALDQSLFIQSTGQSGNFMSPHYDDLSERWAGVEFLPMTTKPNDYNVDALGKWIFEPK